MFKTLIVEGTKCRKDKMTIEQNVDFIKCQMGKFVERTKCQMEK